VSENVDSENARLWVSHDGAVLLVNANGVGIKVFSRVTGELIYDLRVNGGFPHQDDSLAMGLTKSGDRVVCAEYFDDDMFTYSYRVWKKDRENEVLPTEARAVLMNGRHTGICLGYFNTPNGRNPHVVPTMVVSDFSLSRLPGEQD
jgi:hypothetical protein